MCRPVQFVNAPAPAIAQANATVIDQLDDLNANLTAGSVPINPPIPVIAKIPSSIDNLLGLLAISERTLADPDHI